MHLLNLLILQKLLKFGLAGSIGLCLDFYVTWLLKERFSLNKYLATSAGFTTAVINNFLINYFWTFHSNSNLFYALGIFSGIALVGLLLHNFIVYLFHGLLSLNFYTSKMLAVLGVFAWNFTMNYLYNFHSH